MLVLCIILLSALFFLKIFKLSISLGFLQLLVIFGSAVVVCGLLFEIFKEYSTDSQNPDSDFAPEKFEHSYWTSIRFTILKVLYILTSSVSSFHFFFCYLTKNCYSWLFVVYVIVLIILDFLIFKTSCSVIENNFKSAIFRTLYFETTYVSKALVFALAIFGTFFYFSLFISCLIIIIVFAIDDFFDL